MTVKEIANTCNVSTQTIRRSILELFPEKLKKGKITKLSKEDCIKVVEIVRKQGFIQPQQNVEVPQQNVEVLFKLLLEPILKQQNEFNLKLIEEIKTIKYQKQIEIKQDYFSILAYMRNKGIEEAKFSEMIIYGKEASKISRELGKEIRKIPDERFGKVNSYHIEVLEKLFEL